MAVRLKLLIPDSYGIYIPQHFYQMFDLSKWGLDPNDYKNLNDPDNELYWDDWDRLLNNAYYVSDDGNWQLWQDGDLYAVEENYDEMEHF